MVQKITAKRHLTEKQGDELKTKFLDNSHWDTLINYDCDGYDTAGAYGTIPERMAQKKQEAKYLVDTYPDFVCHAEKTGWESGSHVKIRQKNIIKEQGNLFD